MDKKTIILVILLALLFFFWGRILETLGIVRPETKQAPAEQTEEIVQSQQDRPAPVDTTLVETEYQMPREDLMIASADSVPGVPEDSIVIETAVMRVVLTNYGGGIISHKLKNYEYENGDLIQMLPDCDKATPEFMFNGGQFDANELVYEASISAGKYEVKDDSFEMLYSYNGPDGSVITKRYRFYPEKYHYDLILRIDNRTRLGFEREYTIEWNNPLKPTELDRQGDYNSMWAMALMGTEREKFDDYKDNHFEVSLTGQTQWIATRSKYFTAIIMPHSEFGNSAIASGKKERVMTPDGSLTTRELAIGLQMEIPYEETIVDSFAIYAGPADYEILRSYNNKVDDIVDIGTTPYVGWIIKIFAVPIMWLLPKMYNIIPNYGLVIIIFSLLVKVITWPLTKKSVKSMAAMRELQPKIEELKKKHKNNPQALNREMMKLYKEMGINPLSGCLPFLPQMPLFFALFAVFRSTILLRQAPFILWWDDLSRGALSVMDPYIILVVIMVALMFLQQKSTMSDPKNKALTYIFPLMMGFFFYKVSAGLVLYWACFSFFSYMEQVIFRRSRQGAVSSAN